METVLIGFWIFFLLGGTVVIIFTELFQEEDKEEYNREKVEKYYREYYSKNKNPWAN